MVHPEDPRDRATAGTNRWILRRCDRNAWLESEREAEGDPPSSMSFWSRSNSSPRTLEASVLSLGGSPSTHDAPARLLPPTLPLTPIASFGLCTTYTTPGALPSRLILTGTFGREEATDWRSNASAVGLECPSSAILGPFISRRLESTIWASASSIERPLVDVGPSYGFETAPAIPSFPPGSSTLYCSHS